MSNHVPSRRPPALANLPLPGHYQAITVQLNATYYPPQDCWKWVLVAREPHEQIELARTGGWPDAIPGLEEVEKALRAALRQALYLGRPEIHPTD
jgi:hypothetical protein